jgi:alanyl-tRNA synthetase
MLTAIAEEDGIKIDIPLDFYTKVAQKHEREKPPEQFGLDIDLSNIKETQLLFRKDEKKKIFTGKVLKVFGDYAVLDKTCFYPRSGGQEPDHGTLNNNKVYNVEKIGNYVIHFVEKNNLKKGDSVKGKIDWKRRYQIMQHHSATHLIAGAARKILGDWIWQAGSKKDADKAHIDMAHYRALTEDQINKIENLANEFIKKKIKYEKTDMSRPEAEKKYGFTIYQGAPVPSKVLRIVNVPSVDVEACGGTHVDNSSEVEKIIIYKAERPADGTIRIYYKAGKAAENHLKNSDKILKKAAKLLKVNEEYVPEHAKRLVDEWKRKRKELDNLRKGAAKKKVGKLKFEKIKGKKTLIEEIPEAGPKDLQKISLEMSGDNTVIVLFGSKDGKVFLFASSGKKTKVDVGKIVSKLSKLLGGKGGGTPNLAQGIGNKKNKIKNAIKMAEEMI